MKKSIIMLVGGVTLIGGIILRGVMGTKSGIIQNKLISTSEKTGPSEIITVGHDGRSLIPYQIVLQSGKSYSIQITPSRDGIGCMYAATVPTLGSEVWDIKTGETFTIQVDNPSAGTYPVVCTSMGMKQGEIIVQ